MPSTAQQKEHIKPHNNRLYSKFIKRIIDLVVALLLIIVISPLLLIISICIKLDSKGPVFYKQRRIGYQNKEFQIYKFRTMVDNAEKIGAGLRTSENDARITKIGRILRITSLDEVPQIINIIRGEMSIIGPRPTVPQIINKLEYGAQDRHLVLPGVTGLAQINGRQSIDWKEKINYDLKYVKRISFKLDLLIFFKTFLVVFKKESVHKKEISKEFNDL
ncbi:sugar transferase [Gracilibacillus suaedae]|uniref:sugar transferase n=1 Tax=Gracilibacillus suaedae TaxID=2820273 RepID=UPI001ABDEFB5|nr:sugar transferase [Gracilibacillus suaedae]